MKIPKTLYIVVFTLAIVCGVIFVFKDKFKTHTSNKIPPNKLREDVDFLYKQIITINPDPFINCSRYEIDSLNKSIKGSIKDSMTAMQYYRLVRPLISAFNDGHLSIFPDKDFAKFKEYGGKLFPFEVVIDNGRIFIKGNSQKNNIALRGSQIISINNVSDDKLIKTLLAFFSGDSYPYKLKTVEENFAIGLWRAFGFKDSFQLVLGNGKKLIVQGVIIPTKQPNEQASLKLISAVKGRVALLTIPSLVFDSKKGFDGFLDSSFTVISRLKINRLIIDIRNNGGGSTLLARDVFNYITNTPYSVSREETAFENGTFVRSVDTTLTLPVHLKNKFSGKTFLLMNSGTYSSAHMMANTFKYYKMGITVGDSSCERMRISGEVTKIILPASKLVMYCPSSVFVLPSASDQRSRLIPDHIVPLTFKDRINGYDKQLQYCLKLAAQQ
jgi:hypothetical protein